VEAALEQKNHLLVKVYNRRAIDPDEVTEHLLSYAERIRPHVVDVSRLLNDALDAGDVVLFEGAQATISMLIMEPIRTSHPRIRLLVGVRRYRSWPHPH
jgi:adenylosuccinate synthase